MTRHGSQLLWQAATDPNPADAAAASCPQVTGMGAADLFHSNMVAREMILSAGMGRKVGPMDLMSLHPKATDNGDEFLRSMEPKDATEEDYYYHTTDMPTELVSTSL
eukprot:GHRR01029205.1.p1 GENE.GHRR01029205.1~~GHRR01029205.1.p1  ORF type:complete len:107 (-),score=40.82 GHRR01029205.1:543-863(-)